MDSYLIPSLRLIVSSQIGATSLLQRKLKISYQHAGRIMDQLERLKVVDVYNGEFSRKVLIKNMLKSEMLILRIYIWRMFKEN